MLESGITTQFRYILVTDQEAIGMQHLGKRVSTGLLARHVGILTSDEKLIAITGEELVTHSFDSRDRMGKRGAAKRRKKRETHVDSLNDWTL